MNSRTDLPDLSDMHVNNDFQTLIDSEINQCIIADEIMAAANPFIIINYTD